jgi:hypothetical protein
MIAGKDLNKEAMTTGIKKTRDKTQKSTIFCQNTISDQKFYRLHILREDVKLIPNMLVITSINMQK